ncbi:MAG: trypsin-like serine protease, partial [Planctomycetota bacterium]
MDSDHQANLVITIDDTIRTNNRELTGKSAQFAFGQVNPTIGMDADGDYSVAWNGNGAVPHPLDPAALNTTNADNEGIWVRSFHARDGSATDPEFVGVQTRVNMTSGGIQQFPSLGMEPDGDRIVVWNGMGVGDYHGGIFARRYNEPTDTAGPRVSDLRTLTGERIEYGAQLTQPLDSLVVVFDEEMMTTGPDSVLNPDNYSLLKDGVELVGGIVSISFGPIPNPATNKWEAVLQLDGNGTVAGTPPLGNGQYEIVIRNTVRDVVGNRLGRTGLNPFGQDVSGAFDIVEIIGVENLVNTSTVPGDQSTSVPKLAGPNSPRAVASDADGEYVVVWSSDKTGGLGKEGVYAKLFNANGTVYVDPDSGVPASEIVVTTKATAWYASVARDTDGDFVVTWSQDDDADPVREDWNVWARRFDAVGNPFGDAFPVNSVTFGNQQYSAVAMDNDGDIVVAWQSDDEIGNQPNHVRDGDGQGIYAQRFDTNGLPLGGVNEVQVLKLFGSPVGSFTLQWDGDGNPGTDNVTSPISASGNPFDIVDDLEAELNLLGGGVNQVEVFVINMGEIGIHFMGPGAAKNQDQIVVAGTSFADPAMDITTDTLVDGYRGEFLVNDTTTNNQMHPSIAMRADGDFVISWTSAGQDGDAPNETNIYAKRFVSNDVFRATPDRAGGRGLAWGTVPEREGMVLSTSTDNPANHVVNPGGGYDGVVEVIGPDGTGSGILLKTGRHILTAAHVVDADPTDGAAVAVASIDVRFDMPYGPIFMTATSIIIHAAWNDAPENANDLAIIVLPQEAPAGAERYEMYSGGQELSQVAEIVGYGMAGQGAEQFIDGNKRLVNNIFEVYGEDFSGMAWADFNAGPGVITGVPAGTLIAYDFDNGLAANDMFGSLFGIRGLGLGEEEGAAAHGDSGGPAFIDGVVVGVASFILDYAGTDIDGAPFNASFGSAGFYTRVSAYSDWIGSLIQSTGSEFLVNDARFVDPITGLPTTAGTGGQKWSAVAMDSDGDFVITWTSYGQDGSPSPYGGYDGEEGVFAKRYGADGTELLDPAAGLPLGEFLVNTFSAGEQQRSQVAMDADGDFTITWESFQDRSPGGQDDSPSSFGVFAQRYARNDEVGTNSAYGPFGEIGGELPVSSTKDGDQRFASIALDHTGNAIIVWSGAGQPPTADLPDDQGIFHKRFEKLEDEAGPTVADTLNLVHKDNDPSEPIEGWERVFEGAVLQSQVSQFLISFGEDLDDSTTLTSGIENLNNWTLTRDGVVVRSGVAAVDFDLNQTQQSGIVSGATNKYEAVLTFDGDPSMAGLQPLGPGEYILTIRDTVQDLSVNRLDGNYDGDPGVSFRRRFVIGAGAGGPIGDDNRIGPPLPDAEDTLVNFQEAFEQRDPEVASNADGDYVIVWTGQGQALDDTGLPIVDANGNPVLQTDILARRFDRFGKAQGREFIVNSYRTGNQYDPEVAMDRWGNFVVTWAGEGEVLDTTIIEPAGVFARVFDAFGNAAGEEFQVNQFRQYAQDAPSVAMDDGGDFVVSWTSYGQDGDLDGVYARRYGLNTVPKGSEFRVNTTTLNRQDGSAVAMDASGNFVVVWAAYRHPADSSEWGIFGQRYNAAGTALGGEFLINTATGDDQMDAHVAMDADGDFVVTWSSYLQDGSGWGIYGRRYNAAGTDQDPSAFRDNQTTLY